MKKLIRIASVLLSVLLFGTLAVPASAADARVSVPIRVTGHVQTSEPWAMPETPDTYTVKVTPQGSEPLPEPASFSYSGESSGDFSQTLQFGFDRVGIYRYTITQEAQTTAPRFGKAVLDTSSYELIITVVNAESGGLEPIVAIHKPAGAEFKLDELDFTNLYVVPGPTYGDPPVAKALKGARLTKEATFRFDFTAVSATVGGETLTPEAMPMPEGSENGVKTVSITAKPGDKADANGFIGTTEFGKFPFERAGVYVYTITERNDKLTNVRYDGTVYTLTYTVTEPEYDPEQAEDYVLQCSLAITDQEGKEIAQTAGVCPFAFTNTYSRPGTNPKTGDTTVLWPYFLLMAVAVIGLVTVLLLRRKQTGKE